VKLRTKPSALPSVPLIQQAKSQKMKRLIRKLHRYLGLVFSMSILMASGSGIIHVVMTRTQSPPPEARPTSAPLDLAAIKVAPAEAFPNQPPIAVNIRNISGKPHYQAFTEGGLIYVDATNGQINPDADTILAKEIASAHLGTDRIFARDYLTAFDHEYINIFRILPVYRFDLQDGKGTRVYVSTMTGSVTRHTDDQKQFEARIFNNFHKLGFIPNKNLRDLTLTILTGAAFLVSILGITLFFLTNPKKKLPSASRQ
jgi:hypothetical protein